MQKIHVLPIFPERPTNPARTNVRTGDIEINAARWNELPPETREYVLLHELGHYKQQTFDEVEADRYALRHLAGKKPYSLWNYYQSVNEVSHGNRERLSAARKDVLTIAAKKGSKEANRLLGRYANADGSIYVSPNLRLLFVVIASIIAILLIKKFI